MLQGRGGGGGERAPGRQAKVANCEQIFHLAIRYLPKVVFMAIGD